MKERIKQIVPFAVILAFYIALVLLAFVSDVSAAWTPLIQAADFTGIQTDVLTVAAGIVSVLLIVVGLGFLIKTFL